VSELRDKMDQTQGELRRAEMGRMMAEEHLHHPHPPPFAPLLPVPLGAPPLGAPLLGSPVGALPLPMLSPGPLMPPPQFDPELIHGPNWKELISGKSNAASEAAEQREEKLASRLSGDNADMKQVLLDTQKFQEGSLEWIARHALIADGLEGPMRDVYLRAAGAGALCSPSRSSYNDAANQQASREIASALLPRRVLGSPPRGHEEVSSAEANSGGDDVPQMVESLKVRFARHGMDLPIDHVGGNIYKMGVRKLHLAIMNDKLMVRVGGGHAELLDYINQKALRGLPM